MTDIQEHPVIGVAVITYDAKLYIEQCLDSLLVQTYPNIHIVVSDDCSLDGTQEILKQYRDQHPGKIQLLLNELNLGIQPNTNQVLRALGTPYLSIIAGDDYWKPDKLEQEYNALARTPGTRWAYSQITTIDCEGNILKEALPLCHGADNQTALLKSVLCHDLVVLNWTLEAGLVEDIGGFFDESLAYIGDWDFLVRLAAKGEGVFCPDSTIFYRRHKESITVKGDFGTYHADFLRAYRKHLPVLGRLPPADQMEVLHQQRNMLKSTVQLWLKSSLMKKNLPQILRCLYLKCLYKFAPVRQTAV